VAVNLDKMSPHLNPGEYMMTPQEVRIGTRLEFEILNSDGQRVGNTFISQLLEHQDDGSVVISAPITESRVVYVPAGVTVRLTFVHQLHGLLGFKATIRSREYRENIAVLIAEPDGGLEKIQRREYYRLDVIVNALIWPDEADSGSESQANAGTGAAGMQSNKAAAGQHPAPSTKTGTTAEAAPVKGYTKNLSGSGVCIICDTNFPKGSVVRVELELNDNIRFKARCIVMRSQQVEVRRSKSYEMGMRFYEITNKDQDNLIKYIFEQQRILLKKEK
jgi:c-di-GMP-binding flagellar brake protein YcgR